MREDFSDIYFSFWSWSILKDCPRKYKLIVLDKVTFKEGFKREMGNAIQGTIPHAMAEDFFKKKPEERDINFFFEQVKTPEPSEEKKSDYKGLLEHDPNEVVSRFEYYWRKVLYEKDNVVDWAYQGKAAVDKSDRDAPKPPHSTDSWEEYGYRLKHQDTYNCTLSLVKLIQMMDLVKAKIKSEHPFKAKLDDELTIGGRIDVVTDIAPEIVDVLDIKGVKSPSTLDIDQLIFYRLGMKAEGKRVRRTGYILLKQGKPHFKNITEEHEKDLIKRMKDAKKIIKGKNFPANLRQWYCPRMCEARDHCDEFKRFYAGLDSLKVMQPGKVDF